MNLISKRLYADPNVLKVLFSIAIFCFLSCANAQNDNQCSYINRYYSLLNRNWRIKADTLIKQLKLAKARCGQAGDGYDQKIYNLEKIVSLAFEKNSGWAEFKYEHPYHYGSVDSNFKLIKKYNTINGIGGVDGDSWFFKDTSGKYSLINKAGDFITKYAYDSIWFSGTWKNPDSTIGVQRDGYIGVIDKKGNEIIKPEYRKFIYGLAEVDTERNGNYLYGYMNTKGKIVIPLIYSSVRNFDNGFLLLRKQSGKYFFFNLKKGQQLSDEFDEVEFFGEGPYHNGDKLLPRTGIARKKYESYIIDDSGKIIQDYRQYLIFASNYSENRVQVEDYKRGYFYIDRFGVIKIPPNGYIHAHDFHNGYASVSKEVQYGKYDFQKEVRWGFIDSIGNVVIPFKYEDAGDYAFGYFPVKSLKSHKWGYINSYQDWLISDKYKYAGQVYKDYPKGYRAYVTKDTTNFYINIKR